MIGSKLFVKAGNIQTIYKTHLCPQEAHDIGKQQTYFLPLYSKTFNIKGIGNYKHIFKKCQKPRLQNNDIVNEDLHFYEQKKTWKNITSRIYFIFLFFFLHQFCIPLSNYGSLHRHSLLPGFIRTLLGMAKGSMNWRNPEVILVPLLLPSPPSNPHFKDPYCISWSLKIHKDFSTGKAKPWTLKYTESNKSVCLPSRWALSLKS